MKRPTPGSQKSELQQYVRSLPIDERVRLLCEDEEISRLFAEDLVISHEVSPPPEMAGGTCSMCRLEGDQMIEGGIGAELCTHIAAEEDDKTVHICPECGRHSLSWTITVGPDRCVN